MPKEYEHDITFIIPNLRRHRGGASRYWNHIPYAEALLTAQLRKNGYRVNSIDANVANLSDNDLAKRLEKEAGRMVGVSAMSIEYKDAAHETLAVVRSARPDVKTILGGVYPSLSPEIAMKDSNVDFVIISEGEKRLPALMEAVKADSGFDRVDGLCYRVNGGWISTPRTVAGSFDSLDELAFPDYTDFDTKTLFNWTQKYTQNFNFRELPTTIMVTSRGCPYKCTYCGAGKEGNPINDKLKRRSPENVLAEIDFMHEKYGIKEFVFVDDSLLLPTPRIVGVLKGIAERRARGINILWKSNNLDLRHVPLSDVVIKRDGKTQGDNDLLYWFKESGGYQVSVSLESGSPDTLKRMKRPTNLPEAIQRLGEIRKAGIEEICSNFIIGMPGDTWDDIRKTPNLADRLINEDKVLDYALFSIFTPLPGTEAFDEAKANGYLPEDFDPYDFYGFGHGVVTTPEFTPAELESVRALEWDRINFRPERPEHHQKIAKMLGLTMEELYNWRRETRRKSGVKVDLADKVDPQRRNLVDQSGAGLPNLFHPSTYISTNGPINANGNGTGAKRLSLAVLPDNAQEEHGHDHEHEHGGGCCS